MKKTRAFIAIPLPQPIQDHLGMVSQTWAQQLSDRAVRWVRPSLMHITLRFLGDTEQKALSAVKNGLDDIGGRFRCFHLQLSTVGCFPNTRRPRVVWVGLQGQLDTAQSLKQEIDRFLLPLGWEMEDRSFRPHLTVGRVKDSRRIKGFQWQADIQPLTIPVTAVHLIKSELQRSGPLYTILHSSELQE
jgi:2'-5' RNA ligase